MTTRLPFIDRIKSLSLGFISGKRFTLNQDSRYEIEVLPSPTRRGSQQSALSSVHMIERADSVAALATSGTDRFWSASQINGRSGEHTRSNLG